MREVSNTPRERDWGIFIVRILLSAAVGCFALVVGCLFAAALGLAATDLNIGIVFACSFVPAALGTWILGQLRSGGRSSRRRSFRAHRGSRGSYLDIGLITGYICGALSVGIAWWLG